MPVVKRVGTLRAAIVAGVAVAALAIGVAAWRWWDERGAPLPGVAGAPPINLAEKAVAVLPFANQSDDKSNGYFAEGVSDEMLNLLSRVPGLRVSAKNSASHFSGATVPLMEVARQLRVAYLVAGTVRRSGDRIRISVELVNGANGSIIWADSFDRELKDVLVAQTDLAVEIARNLRVRIDASSMSGSGTRNAEAWRLFRQGESMPLGQREEFFNRALQADPKYARVHAALALEVLRRANQQTALIDRREVYQRAVAHANEALRIDPECVQAYVMLAYAAGFVGDSDAFEKNASRVMQLDPDAPDSHELAADSYLLRGRMDESLGERKQVTELDPLEPIGFSNYAWTLLTAGRPAQALAQIDRAIALSPDNARIAAVKARILLGLNRHAEALTLARQAVEVVPFKQDALRVLATVGTSADIALAKDKASRPSDIAALDLYLGHGDAFLSWLETTEVTRVGGLLFDPALDPLRDTPRYRAWLGRTNLVEAQERATAWRVAHPPSSSGSK
jgi:TolB-like protein/Tfp pilus assembly protein PilF